MDQITKLFNRHALSAGVFHTGQLCGIHDFAAERGQGHVHLVKRGPVQLIGSPNGTVDIAEPSLVFLPRPNSHRLITRDVHGADLVCASINFGAGEHNPITNSLPSLVIVPLASFPGAQPLLELLYEEAFAAYCGRQASLDRLSELLLIRLLRFCMDQGISKGGALAGLSDPKLAKAPAAIHDKPAADWSLESMASIAGTSSARFALHFREVTGETPAAYLAAWRIGLAQQLLRDGRPLKHVSNEVGYGSPAALTRAFARSIGTTPTNWLRALDDRVTARA